MPRFLQVHSLTSYPASLLNRDDVGFAKRLPFGGAPRVRISSQCLKRHWRKADDELALSRLSVEGGVPPLSVRSRRTFEEHIYKPLVAGGVSEEIARALTGEVIDTVLPEGKKKQAARETAGEEAAAELHTSQVTVIGHPEVRYLLELARKAAEAASNPEGARKQWKALDAGEMRKNIQAMKRGAGVDAAMFGRMVTGDILARCDAAVHVAHAFTVHPGFFETDYFSAVDDLNPSGETGSGHINTSELTSGLYYGYVVIDLPQLVSNLEGCRRDEWLEADRQLSAEIVRRLVHLIATVTPGAKLGATAPYAHALTVLVESGDSQPRTLANAFLDAIKGNGSLLGSAQTRLAAHVQALDEMYGQATERRHATTELHEELAKVGGPRVALPALAEWAAASVAGEA